MYSIISTCRAVFKTRPSESAKCFGGLFPAAEWRREQPWRRIGPFQTFFDKRPDHWSAYSRFDGPALRPRLLHDCYLRLGNRNFASTAKRRLAVKRCPPVRAISVGRLYKQQAVTRVVYPGRSLLPA